MDASSPHHFGKYRLVGIMASGGMARLFLAVMTGIDDFSRVVMLKQVLPHLAESPEFVKMFLNEARLAAKLDHPNIVRIYELGEIDSQYFISMEYLPGEDLTRILGRTKKLREWIPIGVAATVAQNVAEALQCAHDLVDETGKPLGLVHRDVSLSNVIVTYHGLTKLADFGIAKATAVQSPATRVGTFKGKFAYAAPEQVLGKEVDARTDVFALGIVLWELLTVRRLFKRENDAATVRAVEEADVPPIRGIRPEIPRELEAICMKALARRRRDRFQSAAEMSDALEEFLSQGDNRLSPKNLSKWLSGLFGEEVASLKKAVAQGRGLDVNAAEGLLGLPQAQASILGLKPVPSTWRSSSTTAAEPIGARLSMAEPAPATAKAPSPVEPEVAAPAPEPPVDRSISPRASSSSLRTASAIALTGAHSSAPNPLGTGSGSAENSYGSNPPLGSAGTVPRAAWSTEFGRSEGSLQRSGSGAMPFAESPTTWTFGSGGQSTPGTAMTPPVPARGVGRHTLVAMAVLAMLIIGVAVGIAVTRQPRAATDRPELGAHQVQQTSNLQNRPPETVAQRGVVRFLGVPPGVTLTIDGEQVDPAQPVELEVGTRAVALMKEGSVLSKRNVAVTTGDQSVDLSSR